MNSYYLTSTFLLFTFTHTHNSWNGVSLQSYVDAAVSIALPFVDAYYHRVIQHQGFLNIGQVITLSFLNGYVTFRCYQKTLATVGQTNIMSNESVERE